MIDAVADVSLSIPEGGAFGLVGESGSGKTTLGRAILGLVPVESGEIRLAGAALPSRGGGALKAWRRRIAMTFQDPTGSLSPRLTVRATLGRASKFRTSPCTETSSPAVGSSAMRSRGSSANARAMPTRRA